MYQFWFIFVLVSLTSGLRINFTNCQHPEWTCHNNAPSNITYVCPARSNDNIVHLKDFYTDHIHSLTIKNCRDLKVVLDCPILQRSSRLQKLAIKDCTRLEFISLSSSSLLQTPPEVYIENIKEIISLPRNMFKSPKTITETKCMGTSSLKCIHFANSKINTISSKAIHNISGCRSVEFDNVTINSIQSEGIEAILGNDNTLFEMTNTKVDGIDYRGITVQSATARLSFNSFGEVVAGVVNVTSDKLYIVGNSFRTIHGNGLVTNSIHTDITDNIIGTLKTNALSNIKCSKRRSTKKHMNFIRNTIERVEPYSLYLDYASCKTAGTQVVIRENKMDCKCRNIAYLNSQTNVEQNNLILNLSNNNTCLMTSCVLPVEVVKLLLESDMCHLNLDTRVMCLLYNDKHSNKNEVITDEDVTEPAPTFYLIRQANNLQEGSAAMTAIDKEDLLKDTHLNMTNRTTIKVVFDSSKDFVETLRSTSRTRNRPTEHSPPKDEYVSRCIGTQCRNTAAYNRQRALDFYKYVYAQLRSPRGTGSNENKT
ncbi:uncharacterized protein LOC116773129 [Danaus plexippus]|uniref:uncharacterized protein LOC116773129 n=1 Tax=Danaus plexippus TaxID=13037 RepID=UPI002AAF4A91|nr:uncharacterized protein LOC116773129 [Danaus plexippus]